MSYEVDSDRHDAKTSRHCKHASFGKISSPWPRNVSDTLKGEEQEPGLSSGLVKSGVPIECEILVRLLTYAG